MTKSPRQEEIEKKAFELYRNAPPELDIKGLLISIAEWADSNPASETFIYSDQEHERLEKELEKQKQALAIAVEALEFYGDETKHTVFNSVDGYGTMALIGIISQDRGNLAKEALAKIKEIMK